MLVQFLATTAALMLANLPRIAAEIPATTGIVGSATSEGLFTIQTSVPTSLPPKTPEVSQSSEEECMAVCTGDPGCNKCKSTLPTDRVLTNPLLSSVTGGMTIQTSTPTDAVLSTVTGGMTIQTSTTTANVPPSIATSAPTGSQPAQSSPTGAPTQTTAEGNSFRVITTLTVFATMLGFAWTLL